MNLMDVQQAQTAKPVTKLNGKDIPVNGVGNFASLLQYLVQPMAEAGQNTLPEQQVLPVDATNNSEVKALIVQLSAQPEKVLQLLDQPELEGVTQDPKKTTELLQFIKTMQEGQGEQAMDLFQQLPTAVQQTIVAALSSVLGVVKENGLPKDGQAVPVNTVTNVPSDTKKSFVTKTIPSTVETMLTNTSKPVVSTPIVKPLTPTETDGVTAKSWNTVKKGLESLPVVADPKGNEQPVSLNGLKLDRLTVAAPVLSRTSPTTPTVDEQLATRIEAALKQAPFLKGADGSTRMSIRLYPEQLGEVVVQLDRKEGLLTVKLFAATEQAKQLMDQQLGKLHTSLQPQAPLVKVETGLLASSVKEFEQGLPQERRERQQEDPVPYEEELEEDEDD